MVFYQNKHSCVLEVWESSLLHSCSGLKKQNNEKANLNLLTPDNSRLRTQKAVRSWNSTGRTVVSPQKNVSWLPLKLNTMKLNEEHRKALLHDLEKIRHDKELNSIALIEQNDKNPNDTIRYWLEITDFSLGQQIIIITNALVANNIDY